MTWGSCVENEARRGASQARILSHTIRKCKLYRRKGLFGLRINKPTNRVDHYHEVMAVATSLPTAITWKHAYDVETKTPLNMCLLAYTLESYTCVTCAVCSWRQWQSGYCWVHTLFRLFICPNQISFTMSSEFKQIGFIECRPLLCARAAPKQQSGRRQNALHS